MDSKSKKKLILVIVLIVGIVLAVMGIRRMLFGFAAQNPMIYGYLSLGFVLFILIVVALAKSAANRSDSIGSDGMNSEMRKYMILLGDKPSNDPDKYVAKKCPNCGAPIDPTRPNYCNFCRTKFIDTTKKENEHPIHHDDFNPTRYYDENFTGYSIRSGKEQRPDSVNHNGGYNNGYNNTGYNNSCNDNRNSYNNSYNNDYSNSGCNNIGEDGFLGGYGDGGNSDFNGNDHFV